MGSRVWKRYENGLGTVVKILNTFAIGVLLAIALLVTFDVLLRFLFRRPITGMNEFCELMMIFVVYFTMAHTHQQKGHICVDLVYRLLPRWLMDTLDRFTLILAIGIGGLVVRQAIVSSINLLRIGKISDILGIPLAPFHLALAAGFLAFCLVMFSDLVRAFRTEREK